jgi:hypothetical protein
VRKLQKLRKWKEAKGARISQRAKIANIITLTWDACRQIFDDMIGWTYEERDPYWFDRSFTKHIRMEITTRADARWKLVRAL